MLLKLFSAKLRRVQHRAASARGGARGQLRYSLLQNLNIPLCLIELLLDSLRGFFQSRSACE